MTRTALLLAILAPAAYAPAAGAPAQPAPGSTPAKVERVTLEAQPSRVTVRLGEGKQLQARLKGRQGTVRWKVDGECGSITGTGFYQAPHQCTTPATVRIVASLEEDPSVAAESVVFIEPVSLEVKPRAVNLSTAQTYQFHASVDGTEDQRVRWSVLGGPQSGEISETGLFTSPARFLTPGTITVQATSAADPSKTALATVRINGVEIDVKPKEVTLVHGKTQRFEANIAGTAHDAVEWKVLGEGQGEVSNTGLYSPPASIATPTVVTIVASAAADPSKKAVARVRIEAVQIVGGKRKVAESGKRKGGLGRTAGLVMRTVVRRVSSIYLPFNPVDAIVRGGQVFRGKSGKEYVPLGATVLLGAHVVNSTNDRILWAIEGPQIGEVGPDGVYQAPASITTPAVVQIRATAVADPTKSVIQTLHIPPVVVRSDQQAADCRLDAAIQLKAQVENTENDRIVWTVEGGEAFGSVTETGIYRPAPVMTTPATVRVRASSAADPTKSATIEVRIPELGIDLSPDQATVKPGESVRFKARLKNCDGSREVIWKVTPEVGSISPDGVYRAPERGGPQLIQITATLKADPTKSAVAQVRVR